MTATLPPDLWRKPNWSALTEQPLRPPGLHVAIIVGLLVVWNVLANEVVAAGVAPIFGLVGAAVMVWVARSGGVSWDYLGFNLRFLPRAAKVGLAGAAAATAAVAVATALPVSREIFADDRFVAVDSGEVLFETLFRIPLGTALAEEVAFRGVLLGVLLLWLSPLRATVVSSAAFGLWHILPGLGALETNPAGDIGGGWLGTAAVVAIQVIGTAAAGVLFAWFRFRGANLAAPILVHWGLNASAYTAGWLVVRNGWA